jgi:hypothetical protein
MRSIRARRAGADCRAARKLTYANVASTLALLLVLAGGTAYAANHYLITKTSQIKPSVLKDLRGRAGSSGAPGALGAAGAAGATGATGPAGISGYTQVQSATTNNPSGDQDVAIANCPAGESVLGGGAFGSAVATGQSITTSEPANSDTGWLVAMSNSSASNEHFTAYAICAAVSK